MICSIFSTLSWIVFLPIIGALVLAIGPIKKKSSRPASAPADGHHADAGISDCDGANCDSAARWFAFGVSILTFALSLVVLAGFKPEVKEYQFVEKLDWIPSYGISYYIGVDGISLLLVLLTTFLMPLVFLAARSIHSSMRGYLICMLILESAMLGTLVSLDVFLFYLFWELMLAPMYFIIGIWGGQRRVYATLKFVLYTVVGSLLMLVGIIYVIWQHFEQQGQMSFALDALLKGTSLTRTEELWLFGAFALAFGIKVPIFPFHTWLPDAHVEAPTGGSVVLAGVLLKMGLYGLIRFAYPLFPRAAEAFAPLLAILAVIGIIYGALVAWAQVDIKKLVAYSSVSHLGFCVLGLTAFDLVATSGSIYQMLSHGISTGALFLLVGVLYDRTHTRAIEAYGGLASKVPVFAFIFLVFTLSSIALPLTNGFVGEFMILSGSFRTFPTLTILAVSGVILGAVYMLTLYLKTMFGEFDQKKNGGLTDVNLTELATLAPLFALVFVMGVYPQPFLRTLEPSVQTWIEAVEDRASYLRLSELPRRLSDGDNEQAFGKVEPIVYQWPMRMLGLESMGKPSRLSVFLATGMCRPSGGYFQPKKIPQFADVT